MKKLLFIMAVLSLFLIACENANQNAEKNIALVDGYVNSVQQLDYELMDNYLADDYMGYGPSATDSIGKTDAVARWKENVNDLYEKIDYQRSRSIAVTIADGENQGDWVSNWAQLEITFKEDGEQVTIWANTIYQIVNDKISKSYTFYNEADVLDQLGYIYFNPKDF
ncbi:MAG: nuclear transport factor 2 family protein [Flavobacteriaceae bacterium]